MEFRLRPQGFMELLFCKKLHETQMSQSEFHELNVYIKYIFIYYYYIIALS